MSGNKIQDCYGYFPVFRCLMGHPAFSGVWESGLRFRLLMWIYRQAQWPDKTVQTPHGQTVSRGEFVTSRPSLAENVKWKHGPGGSLYTPTESSIERALTFLEKAGLIQVQSDNRGLHIHVEHYSECPIHPKESPKSVPESDDQPTPQPEENREVTDGDIPLDGNDIESHSNGNRGANEGDKEEIPETSKPELRTLTLSKQGSSSKEGGSGSQRADARPPRKDRSSSSEQHLEKRKKGLTIMATAGGSSEEVKTIVDKLRPVAKTVYKAKRKSIPKQWHTDNCLVMEKWVAEGKTVHEIGDLLDAALEDEWWSPKLLSISMLRKFEDQREERKTNPKTKHKGSNMCSECGNSKYYCTCGAV